MAEQLNGRFCSVTVDNTRTATQRIAAKIVSNSKHYVTIFDLRNRKNRKLQCSSITSIGSGNLVYHR